MVGKQIETGPVRRIASSRCFTSASVPASVTDKQLTVFVKPSPVASLEMTRRATSPSKASHTQHFCALPSGARALLVGTLQLWTNHRYTCALALPVGCQLPGTKMPLFSRAHRCRRAQARTAGGCSFLRFWTHCARTLTRGEGFEKRPLPKVFCSLSMSRTLGEDPGRRWCRHFPRPSNHRHWESEALCCLPSSGTLQGLSPI